MNWFMPAFVKRRFGEVGMSEPEGTTVCSFSRKNSRKESRISFEVIGESFGAFFGNASRGIEPQRTRWAQRYSP